MFNPIEFKHDITSRPLREMWERFEPGDDPVPYALIGMITAAVNLAPAATLIQAGVRGERLFSHVSYARFNPWAKPIFHYVTAASKAERFGAAVGSKATGLLLGTKHISPKYLKAGMKMGGKFGARIGGRLIPGVGWALLAYDVYDIAANRSLWGFDLS